MTETLISLLSIFVGILSAHLFALLAKEYSFDLVGNSIAGVFGSILLIKMFGRLGFDPSSIVNNGNFDEFLLFLNLTVSSIGAIIVLIFIKKTSQKMNNVQGKD